MVIPSLFAFGILVPDYRAFASIAKQARPFTLALRAVGELYTSPVGTENPLESRKG